MPAKKDKSYCDWMSQLPPELHDIPFFKLAIPGMKLHCTVLSHSTLPT